jgi:hypothetical protein
VGRRILILLTGAALFAASAVWGAGRLRLENKFIRAEFEKGILARIARVDGTDALEIDSAGFEVLLFDGSRYTAKDFPVESVEHGGQSLVSTYGNVTVTYALGAGPYLHKTVFVAMEEGDKIDRLQVLRFSTPTKAERGGEGQPVYLGNWFAGMDYPGFYSRHSGGFEEPDFYYRHHYTIDLEGRDIDTAPRDGLVTLFHFPGYAKKQADGSFGVMSKRAVIGLARTPGESAELALMDYIAETRKPPRSNLHFNNWYSHEAKAITVDSFVDDVGKTIVEKLAAQGAHLDNMVPDHGWQRKKDYEYIYQPALDEKNDPLPEVSAALEALGTKLGIWIALDGTNNDINRGLEIGYRPAYGPGFERRERWMQGKSYFDITQPKYLADLKKALHHLIAEAGVDYIKHDFNHNFTTHHLSERHAREACLDITLDLFAYERALNPKVYQNFTNGSWFSPFWMQVADTLWMMSGDSGGNGAWPGLSLREGATAYRDAWFYQSFNNPERCVRPAALPIANFMTHGILYSSKKKYTDGKDTLRDWSDYCVMYMARGTLLKELYITNELLDDGHWKILGRAAAWAQRNQDRLVNTVLVGGDCSKGDAYGYVSWVDGGAILTVRNPDRRFQTLEVPFDASVYFRGRGGQPFKAKAIYPYVEEMPWKLVSGTAFEVGIPGDTTVIYEIESGLPRVGNAVKPNALPSAKTQVKDDSFTIELRVPNEKMQRCDLLIQPWGTAVSEIKLNGRPVEPNRRQIGKTWSLSAYDLRALRGQTVKISGQLVSTETPKLPKDGMVPMEAWLVVDRKVAAPEVPDPGNYPYPIGNGYRRQTQELIPKRGVKVVEGQRGVQPRSAESNTQTQSNEAGREASAQASLAYDNAPLLGIWEYTAKGSVYTREFTPDGYCILRNTDGELNWKAKFEMVSPTAARVAKGRGGLLHELQGDGTMKIEGGKYTARKKQ